ncbi:MAG: radical SAM protein [Elusimicrobiota bacterium]
MDIEKEISIKTANEKQLFNVLFELTYNCNLSCVHCYAINCKTNLPLNNELTTEKWKSIIDELYDENAFLITFSGGDPFLRKDFLEIFRYARKKDFVCNIYTNGNLITDEIINEICDLYPRSVQVSIYSAREEIHDAITQVGGSWRKSFAVLEKLHSKGILIGFKCPLMKSNIKYYEEMKNLAKQFDASLQMDLMISAKNDGNLEPTNIRVQDDQDIFKIISDPEIDGYYSEYKRGEQISDKDPEASICGAGGNGFRINPYGVINVCIALQYPIGNVNNQSVKEIWNNSNSLSNFRKFKWNDLKDCKNCKISRYCIFCLGASKNEMGDMLKKNPYNCKITSARTKYFSKKRG